ncbi:MAG TPA: hypothetical protein VJ869_06160 [Sphaerochaeta sp.]|nr:hypothetical protein [Sphaerochaeta sp.]
MYLHTDKRSTLVMEITSYRVPCGKYPLQDKVYIGRMDENGVFVPNKFFIERSKKEDLEAEVSRLQGELDDLAKGNKKQSKEVKALTEVVTSVSGKKKSGLTHALHHTATTEGFVAALYTLFGDKKADLILSLSSYVLVTKNEVLDDFWDFDLSHVPPCGRDISSSESSAILASITEEHVNEFFKWLRTTIKNMGCQ